MSDRYETGNDGRGRFFAGSAWKGFWLGIVGASVMAALLGATAVLASGGAALHWGHGPWGGFRQRWHGDRAEHAREHARHAVAWLGRWVDASDEQQARLEEIALASLAELDGFHERHHASRGAVLAALSGERVDRDALERIRAGELALAEEASQRLVTALADLADVLTPEQRAELARVAAWMHD